MWQLWEIQLFYRRKFLIDFSESCHHVYNLTIYLLILTHFWLFLNFSEFLPTHFWQIFMYPYKGSGNKLYIDRRFVVKVKPPHFTQMDQKANFLAHKTPNCPSIVFFFFITSQSHWNKIQNEVNNQSEKTSSDCSSRCFSTICSRNVWFSHTVSGPVIWASLCR